MITPESLHRSFLNAGVEFFVGVPDSLLKEFCAYLEVASPTGQHLIAANEGSAIAIASGYHLATNSVPLIYMQNSGLGNAVNPLMSLADKDVYGLPLVLLVGWRGEPGIRDEPQHLKQGRITPALLQAMEIPYWVINADEDQALSLATIAVETALTNGAPVALLVKEGVFATSGYDHWDVGNGRYQLCREKAIECVVEALPPTATIVSTTGKISRELYTLRQKRGESGSSDFLTVGAMGHSSQIALGIAIAAPERLVVCIDGDGAAIMHLGGVTTIGNVAPAKFLHIVINNGAHESVGGQPTGAFNMSLSGVAQAANYRTVLQPVSDEAGIVAAVTKMLASKGPTFLEVLVSISSRNDLRRPHKTPKENKLLFMRRLKALVSAGG